MKFISKGITKNLNKRPKRFATFERMSYFCNTNRCEGNEHRLRKQCKGHSPTSLSSSQHNNDERFENIRMARDSGTVAHGKPCGTDFQHRNGERQPKLSHAENRLDNRQVAATLPRLPIRNGRRKRRRTNRSVGGRD